jgi:putative flippase GtrA
MKRLASFVVVGGIGFVADAAALALLLRMTPVGPFAGRLLSIAFALVVTWLLNRSLTFGQSSRRLAIEGARYGGIGLATSLVNYLVYAALLFALPQTLPLVALAVGSLVAMALSFLGYSRLVFDK